MLLGNSALIANRFAIDKVAGSGGMAVVYRATDRLSGQPVAVNIKTGLTDLDYAEVVSGLSESDSVLVLPSASLVSSQKEFTDRMNRMTGGGGIPGMRQQGTQSGQTGGTTAPAGGARP